MKKTCQVIQNYMALISTLLGKHLQILSVCTRQGAQRLATQLKTKIRALCKEELRLFSWYSMKMWDSTKEVITSREEIDFTLLLNKIRCLERLEKCRKSQCLCRGLC